MTTVEIMSHNNVKHNHFDDDLYSVSNIKKLQDIDTFYRITERIDRGMVMNQIAKPTIRCDILKNVDWTNVGYIERGGVIPYIKTDQGIKFILGQDNNYKVLTDFGGGISYHVDASPVLGSIRECVEESLGVFWKYICDVDLIDNSIVAYSKEMLIIFIKIDAQSNELIRSFNENKKTMKRTKCEIDKLVILHRNELIFTIYTNKGKFGLYNRVRQFFKGILDNYPNFFEIFK